MKRLDYRYDECGLDNVILVGLEVVEDDVGDSSITIHNVDGLQRAIVEGIAKKKTGISGRELRFARTELGLTQAELAMVVSKDVQTVGRWERGEFPIDPTAETVIRVLALQHVEAALPAVEQMASWSVASSGEPPIYIDASDPDNWRPMPMAA
ncbi:helix-turn-helix domain-containing protein [Phenylobacterium sp. NIBR 498073]|uniref:helix-turn-helix domain-containing protein n=1 Tax=Phenylobacterium sp. NIBR 498073 TaxID=3015177 RepID=UPI0022B51857|nr:helix-turn-helix domain-containing protein [Phenylobacterium sp. NIBR 498073]WGU40348.1 helix-turn-helix domain-containing protein [Phenylobacterium sp. NIBR 498073]